METWKLILIIAASAVLCLVIMVAIGFCIKFKCFKDTSHVEHNQVQPNVMLPRQQMLRR